MSLLHLLKENDAIRVKQSADTWEDAVKQCIQPLIDAKTVETSYLEAIIERTKELGPFYILGYGLAMPHERPEKGVLKDSFSFITLEKPVVFSDGQEIDILIGLSATSDEVHNSEAIPQIVNLFEDEATFDKFRNAKNKEEILALIEETVK